MFVAVPAWAVRCEVVALITGHGGCEFLPTSHHFVVGEADFNSSAIAFERYMLAGTPDGCTRQVRSPWEPKLSRYK